MTKQLAKIVGMVATVVVIVLGGILIRSAPVTKQKTRMLITMNQNSAGFRYSIASGPLNVARKNRALVGLGSYLFNRPDVCNAHNAGPGNNQFLSRQKPILWR